MVNTEINKTTPWDINLCNDATCSLQSKDGHTDQYKSYPNLSESVCVQYQNDSTKWTKIQILGILLYEAERNTEKQTHTGKQTHTHTGKQTRIKNLTKDEQTT